MYLFLSHASEDKAIVDGFNEYLQNLQPKTRCDFFYSSNPNLGLDGGNDIIKEITTKIKQSKLIILFVTDNYVKSTYCWYELSIAIFMKKTIIPICFGSTPMSEVQSLLGSNTFFIDATKPSLGTILYKTLNKHIPLKNNNKSFQYNCCELSSNRPYIGSGELYGNIIQYCEQFGVRKFKNCTLSSEELENGLKNSKEIKIITTTGGNLIRLLVAKTLPLLLSQGTNITVLVPNKYSDFCKDVAEIETGNNFDTNFSRLANEFDIVITSLKTAIETAKKQTDTIGKVFIGCCSTLLRQTATLSIHNDGSCWGWVSMTVPPLVTRDGTPSYEVVSKRKDDGLFGILNKHFDNVLAIAKKRNSLVEITEQSDISCFYLEQKTALDYWKNKESVAQSNMYSAREKQFTLIEIAAQHPLQDGVLPNDEYKARLNAAIEVYNRFRNNTKIYVPGSKHKSWDALRNEFEFDTVSLSSAGKTYLINNGVSEDDIYADEMNIKYKADDGVYNSADESYVSSCIFKAGNFSRLICICSPYQCMKKALFYYENGVVPEFVTVSATQMFHSPINEALCVLPYTIYQDHDWQGKNSILGNKSRLERRPD